MPSNQHLPRLGGKKNTHLVYIGNAFAEIKLCICSAIASFDFDEGGIRGCIVFTAGVRDVLPSDVESVLSLWHDDMLG